MFRKYGILLVLLAIGLSLTAFSSPASAAVEEQGNPWWIWVLVFLVLVAFVVFAFWWWMRSGKGEEELGTPAKPEPAAASRAVGIEASEPEAPPPPPQPDDLKRIEGIGPKISGVLQAAGIATFAQLAATDVERLKQILEAENPNLLRLADPTTWPEQAKLAAAGDWPALEKLQGELKGGRLA